MHAFGGVLPWARRELVEKRAWLKSEEFIELLGLCQFLPGPNISNLSIAVGSHFRGARGAVAAFLGLYTVPIVIALVLAQLYAVYGEVPSVQGALNGIASVAAGLILTMALKMGVPLFRERNWTGLGLLGLTFVAVGILRIPLLWSLPTLAFLSIGLAGGKR
jgi:chromate transporter